LRASLLVPLNLDRLRQIFIGVHSTDAKNNFTSALELIVAHVDASRVYALYSMVSAHYSVDHGDSMS